MNALIYHHPVPELKDETGLRQAWARNWQRLGWQTRQLGLREAAGHPRYERFVMRAQTWPTINPPAYELACWIRWLAVDQWFQETGEASAVCCDYDVFNASARPDVLDCLATRQTGLVSLDGGHSYVAAVWVTRDFARIIPALLEDLAMQLCVGHEDRRHISDMMVFAHLIERVQIGRCLNLMEDYSVELKQTLATQAKARPLMLHLATSIMGPLGLDKTWEFLELEKQLWP